MKKAVRSSVSHLIKPFLSQGKARLLIAGFIGVLCASLQSMAINYTIADEGITTTLIYHTVRLLFLGTVGVPLSLWIFGMMGGRYWVALMQLLGTACFMQGPPFPFLNALGFVLTTGPFWGVFGKTYAIKQSNETRGNDTAMFVYVQTFAGAAGFISGGFFLQHDQYFPAVLLSGLGLLVSTFFIGKILPPDPIAERVLNFFRQFFASDNPYRKAWRLIDQRKPTTQLTLSSAAVTSMVDIGLPTWMSLVGMPAVSAGISLSLRPLFGLILMPIIGKWIEQSSLRVGRLGAGFMVLGWVFLAYATEYDFMLIPAMAAWAMASNLIGPTEAGWWLKKRSAAGIVAREILLAGGRFPAIGIMVPLTFFSPIVFPFFGLGSSLLFLIQIRQINKLISFRKALGWRQSRQNKVEQKTA